MKKFLLIGFYSLLLLVSCEGNNEPNNNPSSNNNQNQENYDNNIKLENYENGHEYVDLGLPSGILWATKNVGSSSPEGFGNYFAWGETEYKVSYEESTYKWGLYKHYEKYCTSDFYGEIDNKTILELNDDAAYINWGGNWRIPTFKEYEELINCCTWIWGTKVTNEGLNINGYIITGPSGKSIFLPASGERPNNNYDGLTGSYWSCELGSDDYRAKVITFDSKGKELDQHSRYYGYSIRPVIGNFRITISLNDNFGNINTINAEHGQSIRLPENTFKRKGYDFLCWNTKADGSGENYKPGDNISVTENFTLYALWYNKEIAGTENGYDYVDLGLPSGIKWATYNIGSNKPEEYGYLFKWGETERTFSYDCNWLEYKWNESQSTQFVGEAIKYYPINGVYYDYSKLLLSDDAAHINWGGNWRMPTQKEIEELENYCNWIITFKNGIAGYLITSKINNNNLFIPTLDKSDDTLVNEGIYWTSSLVTDFSSAAPYAYSCFSKYYISCKKTIKACGKRIRPVF